MTEAEEKALREQAYADDLEPEPPKQPEPQQEQPPEPEQEQDDDPWAGVPSALREQIQSISERINTIDNIDYRLKQTERRLGGIQNEFYAAQKAAKESPKGPTPEELEAASKSQKKWDEMKEDFPEIADAIESKLAETKPPDIEALREEIRAEFKQEDHANQDLERRLVGIAHRDWQTIVQSDDYRQWLNKQSQVIQEKALYGQTADDAIDVLDRYKASKKKPPDKKQDRLARSVDAPRGPTRKPPKSEADLSEAELRQQIAAEVWED